MLGNILWTDNITLIAELFFNTVPVSVVWLYTVFYSAKVWHRWTWCHGFTPCSAHTTRSSGFSSMCCSLTAHARRVQFTYYLWTRSYMHYSWSIGLPFCAQTLNLFDYPHLFSWCFDSVLYSHFLLVCLIYIVPDCSWLPLPVLHSDSPDDFVPLPVWLINLLDFTPPSAYVSAKTPCTCHLISTIKSLHLLQYITVITLKYNIGIKWAKSYNKSLKSVDCMAVINKSIIFARKTMFIIYFVICVVGDSE